jgi:NAD(P)-dependent dehydrogenase (short-subunit alcohol dehydrogenase family)/ribosomal protein L40E
MNSLLPPPRKNPVLPTEQFNLPPSARGRVALGLSAAAALGRFELQVCADCTAVQYPPREACVRCLSARLRWQAQSGSGRVLSQTTLHHSNDLYFRRHLPLRLGMVQLHAGPSLMCFLHPSLGPAPELVQVVVKLDRAGQAVLIAQAAPGAETSEGPYSTGASPMANETLLADLTSDPRHRKVLLTDGKTAVGQAMARALVHAGAERVWVGQAEPWKKLGGLEGLVQLPQVTLVPLDLGNERSVRELAGSIGGKVDIVINNAEVHRTHGIADRAGTDVARQEMDINYLGLLRLAQAFGGALKGRAADGQTHATAWVNLLSIYALSNFPAHGTFSASKAAALSLAQCLRAEMRPFGIRVVNLFPGPIDDDWNQHIPPPKLSPQALAAATVKALREGVEDVYPGDIAQDWLQRWRDNPKVLERELAAGGF